jgi:selenocysteine lyase/cysteine desulfurase
VFFGFQLYHRESSSFGLAYISANLPTHALYGTAEEGTVEAYIRRRIMNYMNLSDSDYSMVFTASRGTAYKLLAESYPFNVNNRLLTVYDYESDAVSWMVGIAKEKGAKIMSASFKWPNLKIAAPDLKYKLQDKKKKKNQTSKGLFVFPVQSRVTGANYSYQWMSQAQANKWHVLLDASALAPKDMDSLALSLFRPEFIVTSFYRVTLLLCFFMLLRHLILFHVRAPFMLPLTLRHSGF